MIHQHSSLSYFSRCSNSTCACWWIWTHLKLSHQFLHWACSQGSESCSESCFEMRFWPFPDLKPEYTLCERKALFKSGFWNAKKMVFWIVIHLKSLILRTCEHNTLLERDLCVRIWEMHAGAMHGSICAVGTKYYLAVCRSCSWSDGGCNACECTEFKSRTQSRKRIAIQNGFQNVISSFVNRPNVWLRSPWGKLRLPNHLAAIGYAWMSLIHH